MQKVLGHYMYLTHYRVYDPVTARWLSRDPIGEIGGKRVESICMGMWEGIRLTMWIRLVCSGSEECQQDIQAVLVRTRTTAENHGNCLKDLLGRYAAQARWHIGFLTTLGKTPARDTMTVTQSAEQVVLSVMLPFCWILGILFTSSPYGLVARILSTNPGKNVAVGASR